MNSKYDKTFIKIAYIWAEKSYCKRRQVGAVLVKDSRSISEGYNGTISGSNNCCEEDYGEPSDIETRKLQLDHEDYEKIAKEFCIESGLIYEDSYIEDNHVILKYRRPSVRTKASVVHAEANAIAFAAKEGLSCKDTTLYVTLSPCINCANLIIQSGIKKVIYAEGYRDLSGVEHLQENGIEVIQFKGD